tara:strand:+ start:1530 stop:2075 length:546 start_codon:yes stop_codon:yes gene_type:complete
MILKKLSILNCYKIIPQKNKDLRGYFYRSYCKNILKKNKINFEIKQTNISFNQKKFTFRGFHYSSNKLIENKIISVMHGKSEHHLIDLRKKSKTYLKKLKITLNSQKGILLFVPSGCASGFLTLEKNTVVQYFMDNFYIQNSREYKGFRFDDPFFSINLSTKPKVISDKDINYINFDQKIK